MTDDVGKGFVDKTLCWKGVGRVGEGIEKSNGCTMIVVLCSQSLTRKERLEGKSGLLGIIHMILDEFFNWQLTCLRFGDYF